MEYLTGEISTVVEKTSFSHVLAKLIFIFLGNIVHRSLRYFITENSDVESGPCIKMVPKMLTTLFFKAKLNLVDVCVFHRDRD